MWKSAVGHSVDMKVSTEGDDWETDPDFEVLPGFRLRMLVVVTADPFSPVFRMTCRSRSRGGERRPSRGLDARSTSGRKGRTTVCELLLR